MRVVKGRPILILVAVAVVALLSVPGAAVARSGATKAGQIQTVSTYRVEGVSDKFQRTAIARTGADIVFVDGSSVIIRANQRNLSAIQALGYATTAVQLGDNFPPEDARYHNYDEMVTDINAVEAAHPDIVTSSASASRTRIGTSGRRRSATTWPSTRANPSRCSMGCITPAST